NHYRCYEKPGGLMSASATAWPAHFAVWAPNAKQVLVIGDFNGWLASIIRIVSNWRKQGRLDADKPMRSSAKFAILEKWTNRADNLRVSAAGARHALPKSPTRHGWPVHESLRRLSASLCSIVSGFRCVAIHRVDPRPSGSYVAANPCCDASGFAVSR